MTQAIDVIKILDFLKTFTAGLSGYLQVEAIESVMVVGDKPLLKRKTVALDNIDELAGFIEQHKNWNLYFRPNLLKNSEGSGKGGSTLKIDILAGTCFHVDLDPNPLDDTTLEGMTLEAKRAYLEAERERIKLALANFKVPPSFVIDSGGGYQAFWKLEAPISTEEAEAFNDRLCTYFDTPDSCWSIQHLMRLPFTINWPGFKKFAKGRSVVPTKLLVKNANTYTPDDFTSLPAAKVRVTTKGVTGKKAKPDSTGLPERFVELLADDKDLQKRWSGNTEGLADTSGSGLDMSLTSLLVKRGFNDAEIIDIHKAFPYGKVVRDGRGEDYIRTMLAKSRADRTLSRTEPWFTAHRLIAEWFTTDDGTRLLRHWNGDTFAWCDGAYRMREKADLTAKVWEYLGSAWHYVSKKKNTPFGVNRARSGDVLGALEAVAHLDSSIPNPSWLDGATGADPKDLLVMANGILHMPTRELIPHTAKLFTTMALPYAYAPDADPPKGWLRFMHDLFGDDVESIETLQEIFGYVLTCDTSQQKIFMVVGPKRAGKGVIARILRALVGEMNYIGPTLASLSTHFGLEPFIGKRLAIFSDVRLSGHIDQKTMVERQLALSGEDTLSIPRKYKADWTGTLKTRQIMFSNELPKMLDDSMALASRFIILRLLNSFLGREDTDLTERLLKELPAILNWSLVGLDRLNERGYFRQPASALELVEELERLSSPISAFIQDKCVVDPAAQVGCDQLYHVYELYCRQEGGWQRAPTKASFSTSLWAAVPKMKRKKVGPKGNQHRVYVGVGLAIGTATVEDLQAKAAELVDLDAVRAKNRALLL